MSNVFIIIQARMTSTRLPGKVMLPLCGSTVLQVLTERIANWKKDIIIATTNDGSEKAIIDFCKAESIRYFQGDTDDVLGRYYEAAVKYGASQGDIIVRLTSDCPLLDQSLLEEVISVYRSGCWDMVSLGPHSGYPRGMDTTAFSFELLELANKKATLPSDREHVTLGFNKFQSIAAYSISAREDLTSYRLTLDEELDYECIQEVYRIFGDRCDFSFEELISALREHPDIAMLNSSVQQKSV